MFGGSVSAGADLLPPAGDGWHSPVEVRDGNVRLLGNPLARGSLGYPLRLFSLPLARWLMWLLQRANEGIGPYECLGSAQQLRSRWRLCRLRLRRTPCG